MMLGDRLCKGSTSSAGVAIAILALTACVPALSGVPADAAAPSSVVISYPEFSAGAAGLQLNGAATLAESALRLTPAQPQTRGSSFSRTEFQPGGSFATEFELYMHDGTELPADGIAFVLQPGSAEALGKAGGAMGYQGLAPSVEVEFDLFRDFSAPETPTDPLVPNISLMENGDPIHHLATSAEPLPFPLIDEHVWAWIEYDAETSELSVFANNERMKPENPLFPPYKIDLRELLGEYTYAGFTSGTGQFDAVQDVLDWQLSSELPTRFVPAPPASPAPASAPASATSTTTTTAPSVHMTSTSVTCALVVSSAQNTCTASVADTEASSASNPSGSIAFASATGGAFGAGSSCVLVPVPGSASASSCPVQFSAPTDPATPSSFSATYAGDPRHAASVGAGSYVPSRELAGDISFSPSVALSADGKQADVTFFCRFACNVLGELTSGSNFAAETAAVKRVALGKGVLRLGRPAKGELRVTLNSKARKALRKAAGRPVKGIFQITAYTATGTLVKRERKSVTIRPPRGAAKAADR